MIDEAMTTPLPPAKPAMRSGATLLLVMTLAGLALFFWLAPRTPVVATPAIEELAP